jgi:DNA-binding LytR/AlgR family response regulator
MESNNSEKTIVYFNTRDEMVKINLHNVVYFQADRNYTDIFFINGAHITLTTGLVNIEKMLDDPKLNGLLPAFIRLGRSFIVNPIYIFHINVLKQELVLSDTIQTHMYRLQVSRDALKKLKELYKHS